jgi:hypothetical protein
VDIIDRQTKVVDLLRSQGHDVVASSRSSDVDVLIMPD